MEERRQRRINEEREIRKQEAQKRNESKKAINKYAYAEIMCCTRLQLHVPPP